MTTVKNSVGFNPVKEEVDGSKAKRMIWSTRAIELAIKGLNDGKKLIFNPFYEKNSKLLKGDLVFERTDEEIKEWIKCKNNISYFVEKYCKLMTPEGIKNVKLRDYQKKYLEHLESNRLSIYLACRQCGKTTTTGVFLLHYICFNTDKNTLIVANKFGTSREIIDKIKKIYVELPYFIKPGIYKWNESEIVMDNGCRVQAEATTINSGIGQTIHMCIWDEAAHVNPNIADKFYNNLFPTLTAAKAKMCISSTQNGRNLFYRLYKAAEAGESDYKAFKTDWNEVPEWNPEKKCWERRDEAWRLKQVANYGSEEAFNSQFGTNFDISANTLISQKILSKRMLRVRDFIEKELPGVSHSYAFYWHPDFDPMNLRKEFLVFTCDLAEGGGGDYTISTIYRMIEPGSGKLECIGFFRSNKLSREEVASSLQELIVKHCDQNKILLSYEKNVYGDLFYRELMDNMENNPALSRFDPSILVKYYNESGSRYVHGIKITPGNKTNYCKLFKESYERDLIINDSRHLSVELGNFNDDGTGHFKAVFGHDDLVMASVQLEFVKSTGQYTYMRSDFDSLMESAPIVDGEEIYNPYETAWSWGMQQMELESIANSSRLGWF